MRVIDRPAVHSTWYPGRPICGIVLHDTEGASDLTTHDSAGGWHWLVGRHGTIYRDCDEEQAAWHVLKTDRWRPSWTVPSPNGGVSDANYCTIGIEIVSCEAFRTAGVPYTDAQYAAVRELLADIYQRRGALPIVFHGQLQSDRSDPVQLDVAKAGLAIQPSGEYRFVAASPPAQPPTAAPEAPTPAAPPALVPLLGDEDFLPIGRAVFGEAVPFAVGTGLTGAWLAELRAGRFRGSPLTAERELAGLSGAMYQVFENGVALYVATRGVTWSPLQWLTDAQLQPIGEAVFSLSNALFAPGTGITDSWVAELRAGRYRGTPRGAEVPLLAPSGAKYQRFQHGVALYLPGYGVSWSAFAGQAARAPQAAQPIT